MQNEETCKPTRKKLTQTKHFKKFITLTHHNKSTQKIAKIIKKLKYNIAYTTNNTLKRHLTNKITHNTKHEKHTSTGFYKLKCNNCPKYYIGQTGRSFKTRFIEHIKELTQPLIKIKLFRTYIQHSSYIHQH